MLGSVHITLRMVRGGDVGRDVLQKTCSEYSCLMTWVRKYLTWT